MLKSKSPINLDLTTIKFPLTAITSILHRVSGILLFLLLPIALWLLSCSVQSAQSYSHIQALLASRFDFKLLIWVLMACTAYHLIAGVRHLLLDLGVGETKEQAKASALVMLGIFVIVALLLGAWIW